MGRTHGTTLATLSIAMDGAGKKTTFKISKVWIFTFLILVQIGLIFFWYSNKPVDTRRVFLIKDGNQYTLFWNEDGQYQSAHYLDLAAAIRFAQSSLNVAPKVGTKSLFQAPAPIEDLRLESSPKEGYVLHWKHAQLGHLNHLTFQRAKEARFFETAFRRGAYSTSPFGHAIILTPLE